MGRAHPTAGRYDAARMTLGLPIWLTFPLGFVLLIGGAEWLVRGAARLAGGFGVPPLVIGLTVVAFGTSAPELAVSTKAGLEGNGEIALGNVVGSNIANVLLILGASALVAPLVVRDQLVRVDVPIMVGCAAFMWIVSLDGFVTRLDGGILTLGLLAYIALLVWLTKRDKGGPDLAAEVDLDVAAPDTSLKARLTDVGLLVVGLALLVVGADWLVQGATDVARRFGVSQLVIGLTVVAVGTSLPELATSILASMRGQRDIAVGNIVGSNIFNVLCVLGISALVTPADFPVPPGALRFDIPVMFAVCLAALPIFFTGGRINRWEGGLLLGYFVAYTTFLVLDAKEHALRDSFGWVMLAFVLPLTGLGLLGSMAVSINRRRRRRRASAQV